MIGPISDFSRNQCGSLYPGPSGRGIQHAYSRTAGRWRHADRAGVGGHAGSHPRLGAAGGCHAGGAGALFGFVRRSWFTNGTSVSRRVARLSPTER
jgi:hypothetical protein